MAALGALARELAQIRHDLGFRVDRTGCAHVCRASGIGLVALGCELDRKARQQSS